MHHLRKKKAVETYSGKEVTKEQMVADGYSPEEADEILAALTRSEAPAEEIKPEHIITPQAKPAGKWYEEWRMERAGTTLQKLKLLRPCVKITDREAEILNEAAKNSTGGPIKMYFKS